MKNISIRLIDLVFNKLFNTKNIFLIQNPDCVQISYSSCINPIFLSCEKRKSISSM